MANVTIPIIIKFKFLVKINPKRDINITNLLIAFNLDSKFIC